MAGPAHRSRRRLIPLAALAVSLAGIVILSVSSVDAGRAARRAARAEREAAGGPDPRVFAVALDGRTAYLARTGDLLIAAIENPAEPRPLATLELPFTPRRLSVAGTRLYAAAETHGLVVVDVADRSAPRIVFEHDDYARVRHALPLGDYLLLAAHRDGLHVLDVSRPERPRRVARVSTRGELAALSLDGTRLATAEGQAGVRLFDLSQPEQPREIGRWTRCAAGATDVELVGETLWVTAGRRGVLVLDPARSERLLHEIAFERPVHALARSGDRMLVVGGHDAFALPIDEPNAPAVRVELPRRPALAGAALEDGLIALALDTGWALVELEENGSRVRWPTPRRMRVTFD